MLRVGNTHNICFEFSTIYTNALEYLFHFDEETCAVVRHKCRKKTWYCELTRMKYGTCKLDVAKMPRALCHTLATGCALEVAVDSSHTRVLKTTFFRALGRLIHYLGKLNLGDRVGFLVIAQHLSATR